MITSFTSRRWSPRQVIAALAILALLQTAGASNSRADDDESQTGKTYWWYRLRTTAYSFQSVEGLSPDAASTQNRLGGYQHYDGLYGGLANGHLSLRLAGRFADDLALDENVHDRSRLYVGYLDVNASTRSMIRGRLGRQFLQEGPTSLTMDGAWFDLRAGKLWNVHGWAGARSPLSLKYELADFDKDSSLGLRMVGRVHSKVRVGFSYAYRELDGAIATRPLGLELTTTPLPGVRALFRGAYDTEVEKWRDVNILAQLVPARTWPDLTLQYLDRRPRIGANSYFARFSQYFERIRLARASLRYQAPNRVGGELEYFGAFVEERTSAHIGAALLVPYVRLGYAARVGDTGEESRWYGDAHYGPLPWLELEAGAAISTYALMANAPESQDRELTTAFARVRADLRPGMVLTLEVQSLENPFYSEDVRFLAGLDLFGAGGRARTGLGTGGWLR